MATREIDIVKRSEPSSGPGSPTDDGPLSALQEKIGEVASIKFPQNIEKVDNYMIFSAYKEHAFQGAVDGMQRSNMQKVQSVKLPMPSNLMAGYNQTYKEEAVGAAGMLLGQAIGGMEGLKQLGDAAKGLAKKDLDPAKKAMSALGDRVKNNIGTGGGMGAALNVLSGPVGAGLVAATPVVGGPITAGVLSKGVSTAMAIGGVARNPHMAVFYDTPQFRTFEFGFEFRPKNQFESLSIAQIIHFFKFYSHPEYEGKGHFFNYPNQFKIGYKHPEFLHSFNDAVCKSVTVDYHGEGTPLYYDATNLSGGRKLLAPAVVKLQVSFQEVKILTKTDIARKGR